MVIVFIVEKGHRVEAGRWNCETHLGRWQLYRYDLPGELVFSIQEVGRIVGIDRDCDVAFARTHSADADLQADLGGICFVARRECIGPDGLPGGEKRQQRARYQQLRRFSYSRLPTPFASR